MIKNSANLQGKKILFIAYFYPPALTTNVPGAMRTIKFIRNLTNGQFHVLTTPKQLNESDTALPHLSLPINGEIIYRIESWDIFKLLLGFRSMLINLTSKKIKEDSSNNIPQSTVFKSHDGDLKSSQSKLQKLKDFVYNLCYFPDQAGPWILPASLKGKKLVKTNKIDVIFATGSPWSGLITGYLISKSTGKPLIIDFRDPWMNNPFHHSKGKLLDKWARYLEAKVVNHASLVSLNTEPLKDDFLYRFPRLPPGKFFVLPNGFDISDFTNIKDTPKNGEDTNLTFCHAGFLYGVRDPSVLLNAIQKANKTLKKYNKKICFKQIGDIQLNYDIKERYQSMTENGALEIVTSKPYKECLTDLKNADWVVNIQPGTKTQIPSKLYDYLAISRPILNITDKEGALGKLVSKHKFGELFNFEEEEKLSKRLIEIALTHDRSEPFKPYAASSLFDCAIITKKLSDKLAKLSTT